MRIADSCCRVYPTTIRSFTLLYTMSQNMATFVLLLHLYTGEVAIVLRVNNDSRASDD